MEAYVLALLKKRKGFTLIELLIVISIIGILVAVGAVSYTQVQKKSRDSRRRQDMKTIQNAFEQFYSDNSGVYQIAGQLCNLSGGVNAQTTYLPAGIPVDPKTGSAYVPTCPTTTSYCSCALLENTTDGNASDNSCTFAAGGSYFCVKNLQ